MYCPKCGAKIPDKKTKFCPSCGTPIIDYKKSSPIVDAIILGSIIVLFVFAVVKISDLLTNYRLRNFNFQKSNPAKKEIKAPELKPEPNFHPPSASGNVSLNTYKDPKTILYEKIKSGLKGVRYDLEINYNKYLGGFEVNLNIYKNNELNLIQYLNMFANVFAAAYGDPKNNVKFVVCKVKEKNRILLSLAIGAMVASKVPLYTWNSFGANGLALVRWVQQHQSSSKVSKVFMCRYQNNF